MGTKTYDVKCYELAEMFLSDEEWFQRSDYKQDLIAQLAGEVQQTLEDELEHLRESLHVNM